MSEYACVAPDVELGEGVRLSSFVNLYGCKVGENTKIGAFVEIQKNATVGKNCKISSHTFVCEGVHMADNCFIGHGVMFINDKQPLSTNPDGTMQTESDWMSRFVETYVEEHASIGSNATILGGIRIGRGAMIGAGAVVTKDVPPGEVWVGNPARKLRDA